MSDALPHLDDAAIRSWIAHNVPAEDFVGKRLLLIVPDSTRTAPLPLLFDALFQHLRPLVTAFDVMVALGTHPPMSEAAICRLLGIDPQERQRLFAQTQLFNHEWDNPDALATIGTFSKADTEKMSDGLLGIDPQERQRLFAQTQLFNHEWDNPAALATIGTFSKADTEKMSDGLLSVDVPVQINAEIDNYDALLVLGPVFPHEVVGFSGGNKYFFPGIAGPDLLNFFHWLGALITNVGIIGVKDTPVRRVVDRAAAMIRQQRRAITFVVPTGGQPGLHGLSYGTPEEAWNESADLSGRVHIIRKPKPFQMVLSCAPPMYDELWVAGKCMYKLEPVVADGGELIIYAPHMKEISVTHGRLIEQVGYHCRDYFTQQWEKFKEYPWGVLAHSTHVRGGGTFVDGVERCRVQVTLATGVPEDVCRKINLGYRDPKSIDVESYAGREDEGVLLVRKAGEQLYRLEDETT